MAIFLLILPIKTPCKTICYYYLSRYCGTCLRNPYFCLKSLKSFCAARREIKFLGDMREGGAVKWLNKSYKKG